MAGISRTVMESEVKQWLKGFRDALQEEARLQDEVDRWDSKAKKVTTSFSKAPGGSQGTPASFTVAVDMMMEVQDELAKAMARSAQRRLEIEQVINTLPDEDQKTALRYLYIEGMNQYDVADKIGYSRETISRIHAKSLNCIANSSHKVTFICGIMVS